MSQQDSPAKKSEKSKDKEEIKKEEEKEEEKVEPAPIGRLLKYNKPEWCFMIVGSFCSALVGVYNVHNIIYFIFNSMKKLLSPCQ